jgi:hypothetical protein
MKLFSLLAIASVVLPLTSSVAAAEGIGPVLVDAKQISVNGNGHKRSFPCNGRALIVEGTDHVVTTTGVCSSVEVTGANNSVTAEVAPKGKLIVAGTLHKVEWKSTGEPVQDMSGVDNQVKRVK